MTLHQVIYSVKGSKQIICLYIMVMTVTFPLEELKSDIVKTHKRMTNETIKENDFIIESIKEIKLYFFEILNLNDLDKGISLLSNLVQNKFH